MYMSRTRSRLGNTTENKPAANPAAPPVSFPVRAADCDVEIYLVANSKFQMAIFDNFTLHG
jgi:hypothetical protein